MEPLPPSCLVGRESELAVSSMLVQDVARGASATLLIEGEAGIGKTRLVQSMVDDAAGRGMIVIRGGAHPFERTRPFGAVAQALDLRARSRDPRRAAIGRLLNGDSEAAGTQGPVPVVDARYLVVEEIIDLVETCCGQASVLMVLEDLHWADESTLLAFGSIAQELNHAPLLLVGTFRPTPRARSLDQLLERCVIGGAPLLRLRSLTSDEITALVQAQIGLLPGPTLASIVAKAGGNPLWVVEMLRSLVTEGWLRRGPDVAEATADSLPDSFRHLVLRRLQYLPTAALELLQMAAVLGDAVSVHDLAAVARRSVADIIDGLAEAFRARLLDDHDEAVVFRHELVREAIYEDLPRPVRRALHRDAAGALARAGADLSKVASHLVHGAARGDLEAIRWLRQAAAEIAAGAPTVAVELLRRAETLLPAGHSDADLVTAELAEALLRAGRVAEASTVAEAVLERPHRAEADVPLRLTLVSALSLQNRAVELIDQAEAALQSPALRLPDQSLVLTQASYGRTFSGDFTGGEAMARRALELAERAGSTAMMVWSLAALSVPVKTQGRYGEALGLTRRAVALAFDPADSEARLRHPHFFLAMALSDSDVFDEARLAYLRAISESEQLGSAWLLPDMLLLSAESRFLVGEWDDAAVELESGMDLAHRHGQRISIPQSLGYQAVIAVGRGDLEAARAVLAEAEHELAADVPTYGAEMVAFATSLVAETKGDPAHAYEVLHRSWTHDLERGIRYYHRYLAPPLVRLSITLGRDDVARRVVEDVEAGAALAPDVPSVQSAALRCRGLANKDPTLLLEAVEWARRSHRLLDHAGACEDAASALTSHRSADATEFLLEAQARYETIEAGQWTARVTAELRRLGVRQGARGPRRRADTGWDSLTRSERAVTDLVSEGLTNREVARRLHISPHTVNTHLRHVFQKLSVSTRAELAAKTVRALRSHREITHSSDDSRRTETDAGP
jgi:DNA-binding CsgD family transcriptional regulator/tetratricopeptide (TPR) repeat protein